MDKLNQWLTLTANLGVIAGIVFLAIEIQQNTESLDESRKLAIAENYQLRAGNFIDLNFGILNTPGAHALYTKYQFDVEQIAKLSNAERRLLITLENSRRIIVDNLHYQHEQGYLDPQYYEHTFIPMLKTWAPTWRALGILQAARPSFIAEIDRVLASEAGRIEFRK